MASESSPLPSSTAPPASLVLGAPPDTLTDGLLEDALEAFEPVVAAVKGGVTARGQQRWFAALVMRALGVQALLIQPDAEKAGARLLKQAAKVRKSVAKASNSGEPDKIDVLRRAP